jgi:hypothetical protein
MILSLINTNFQNLNRNKKNYKNEKPLNRSALQNIQTKIEQ